MPGQEHLGSLRGVIGRGALAAVLLAATSCRDTTAPLIQMGSLTTNLSAARGAWLKSQPVNYSFEWALHAIEWGPPGSFEGVVVANGAVVEPAPPNGFSPPTLEEHWQRILMAAEDG